MEQNFSPKAFMKNRRPERFSDSKVIEKGTLDRVVLEHFISTLNTRSQELEFETFSKKLCEKVVCPNLLEQTGPVAGGDGKTDTQTFPVSDHNQLLWYVGTADFSHQERWAFAVSTRKDWKKKCQEDVKKIADTNRGYSKIFCVTNQYIKSNQRSELEDLLKKEIGIDIRILDISWILDQVYSNGYEQLAIETLSVPTNFERETIHGSNDYQKKQELEALDSEIKNKIDPKNINVDQVSLFLRMAILSSELENPEIESQGLFERAIKIANRFGTHQEKIDAYYNYAWYSFWWFEDFQLFVENTNNLYNIMEDTTSSSKWELIINLLVIYSSHVKRSPEKKSKKTDEIIDLSLETLQKIALDDSRPGNALLAKTHINLFELTRIEKDEEASLRFIEIKKILQEGQKLVGYPFEKTCTLLEQLDEVIDENDEFEELIDFITEVTSQRSGEVKASLNSLNRAIKKLQQNKPHHAITLAGKTISGLYKEESREAVIKAFDVTSLAYEKIGLIWAARASSLSASSLLTDQFWRQDELNEKQVKSYIRIAWIELKLGRLAEALTWFELALIIDNVLPQGVLDEEVIMQFDGCLSHYLANANIDSIRKLERVPFVLENLNLFHSYSIILYSLGYEQQIKEEFGDLKNIDLKEYQMIVRDADIGADTTQLNILSDESGHIETLILGCNFIINFPLRSPYLEFAEGLLAYLEGFFATGITDKIYATESKLIINFIPKKDDTDSISNQINTSGSNVIINTTFSGFNDPEVKRDYITKFKKYCFELLSPIFQLVFFTRDPMVLLEKLFSNDDIMARLSPLYNSIMAVYNIIGKDSCSRFSSIYTNEEHKEFNLKRETNWDDDIPKNKNKLKDSTPDVSKFGETPDEIFFDKLSHNDIIVHDIIKPRLWDKTTWKGIGFYMLPDQKLVFSLVFKHENFAEILFDDLSKNISASKNADRLKITILKGVDGNNPAWYRVIISENLERYDNSKIITMINRQCTMTPQTDINLSKFISILNKLDCFYLGYSSTNSSKIKQPKNNILIKISKENLVIKDAWKISSNDIEKVMLYRDDDIFIPKEIANAPVLDVIEEIRKLHQ